MIYNNCSKLKHLIIVKFKNLGSKLELLIEMSIFEIG